MIGSAKYYLQVSIECCLDVTNHIIASEHFRAPKDYADSFMVIEEEGLVSDELGKRLRQMAKFRNRLVHLYGEMRRFNKWSVASPERGVEGIAAVFVMKRIGGWVESG